MTPARQIIAEVAHSRGLTAEALMAKGRGPAPRAHARQDAYRLIRERLGYTLPQIGAVFGRHHATVLHGIRASEARARPSDHPNDEATR